VGHPRDWFLLRRSRRRRWRTWCAAGGAGEAALGHVNLERDSCTWDPGMREASPGT